MNKKLYLLISQKIKNNYIKTLQKTKKMIFFKNKNILMNHN